MCTDRIKRTVWDYLRQRDLSVFACWLAPELFAQAAQQAGIALGSGALHGGNLVWLAVASALHTMKNFASVLGMTLKLLRDAPDWHSSRLAAAQRRGQRRGQRRASTQMRRPRDPRGRDPIAVSEEAFVQARQRMPWSFWIALLVILNDRFEAEHAARIRWKQFRLLALDGTTINMPRWKRLADYFGTASNGKTGRTTQARMVMLQLPLVRVPWRYELTPLSEGERTVAGRLLNELRGGDLLLMDRGFWSYGLFWQILEHHADFAVRKMSGVHFRKLQKLDRDDRLVLWQPSDRKWRRAGLPKTMQLREITYQLRGFSASAIVTSVCDPRRIIREEWLRLAAVDDAGLVLEQGLYHRRWEIETIFNELKVVQGMEGSLRSRKPEGIRYEVAGHVLLYLLVRWLMVQAAQNEDADPLRLSFSATLNELADMRETLLHASAERIRRSLLPCLLARIANHRVPFRPGRHYSRPHDTRVKNKGKGKYQRPSKLERRAA